MKLSYSTIIFQCLLAFASCALPTLYEYYTGDGISSGLSVDQPYFTLNGKNITIYGGAMHYFRVPPQHWRDRLRKLRAAGLNTVETILAWNIHEPRNGYFDFGSGGTDMEAFLDLEGFLTAALEEDLLVIVRPGPYTCGEWEWGGFPSWLLREDTLKVRTSEQTYMKYVERYFGNVLPILAKYQFTNGGPIIAVQVENEYGYNPDIDKVYLQSLVDLMKSNGIVELLFTSDGASSGTAGTLPGVLFQTVNFGSDAATSFHILEGLQPGKPVMAMEFYPGWFDHWSEGHHTLSDSDFRANYEDILGYPASVNLYMFHGGTNWGFFNGANIGPGDNSQFQPTTTSYDYNAPLTEAGDYTSKYDIIRELLVQYNPIETLVPDPPELVERQEYPTLSIDGYLTLENIVANSHEIILTTSTLSMEQLPINDDSGQSYGYIVYREGGLNISAYSNLTITGHIRDTVMVLLNGVLISSSLSSSDDFNNFGYWRLENSTITLTTEDLTDATLDIVIENFGRANFGNMYHQFKGLVEDNRVFLNDEELWFWVIYPLEFQSSWTKNLTDWNNVSSDLPKGPGLYKATLTVDEDHTDTFIDMSEWNRGVVIVNGFVLGRYAFIGPQQTLYLPGPFLQTGDNDIVIFEHFEPASEVKFSKDAIFSNP
ncbi:beta-galactosidase-1-like protein 2 [Zophobas morio]|uniref:beta-galactosidase-1-like protein 2 n=1 Tax=Zophobas morio TaxID=2755281 RepID=UPI003082B9F6